MSNPTALVQKLWNYCSTLRYDRRSYGDYVEQLTFLLFLKMADEAVASAVQQDVTHPCGSGAGGGERSGGVGVGGVRQPPARHPPLPVHFAERV